MAGPLTRPYAETRRERAQQDPEFGHLIFRRAIKCLSKGDLVMGRWTLHNYIDATIGFEKLGKALGKQPSRLKRMLTDDSKTIKQSADLAAIIKFLRKAEDLTIKVAFKPAKQKRKPATKSRQRTSSKVAKEAAIA